MTTHFKRSGFGKAAAEMLFQVTHDFLLDRGFQHHQHKTEVGLDSELGVFNLDLAMNPGPFKMDDLVVPTIVDSKFFGQVARQLIRSIESVFMAECVIGVNIDRRHYSCLPVGIDKV